MRVYDPKGVTKRNAVPTFQNAVTDSPGAAVNNYAPTGWSSVITRLEITPASGGSVFTGLDSASHQVGDVVVFVNVTAVVTDVATLVNQSGASLAANRFIGIGGEDYLVLPGAGVLLLLDSAGWRFLL